MSGARGREEGRGEGHRREGDVGRARGGGGT